MLFYCEAKTKDGVVLDVNNLQGLEEWWGNMGLNYWNESDQRSLIELKNINAMKFRGFREGLWYEIPDYIWSYFEFDEEKFSYDKKDSSLLFRLSAFCKEEEQIDFTAYRSISPEF